MVKKRSLILKMLNIGYFAPLNLTKKQKQYNMKKLILSTIGLAMAFTSFSQQNLSLKHNGILDLNAKPAKKTGNLSKIQREEWYNPLDILRNGDFKNYVGFMMFDSLANYKDEQGVASQGRTRQGVGQIVDPKDDAIELNSPDPTIKMSRFTNYTVDSIDFRYSYVRRVDSTDDGLGGKKLVIDTLFVYYFSGTQIIKRPKASWGSAPYGLFGYDYATRRPKNYLSVDTVLLTAQYSTGKPSSSGWSIGEISLKPNVQMNVNSNNGNNTNNLVGFAFFFKNGTTYDNTYTYEDRRDSASVPAGTKWVNYFLYRFGANEGSADLVSTFYNSSVIVPQENSYKEVLGWTGFVTGLAYTNAQYLDAGMKLSSSNISVKEVANSFSLGQAYPNPSSNVVNIAFDLKASNNVKVSILNLLGQEVINIADDKFAAGKNEVSVDVSNLNAGVYFYSMTVDGVSQAQKLIIK